MPLAALLGFAAIAFTLIAVPGADWAHIVAAGAKAHVVIPAVAGLAIGYLIITVVVAAGVGPVIATAPFALTALTLAGAAYLMYVGVRTVTAAAAEVPHAPVAAPTTSRTRYLVRGIGVSALNPKGLLIFLSILPQFAHQAADWPVTVQLATLGGVFVVIAAVFYLALGYVADRVIGTRLGFTQITTRIAGIAMILVGLALLVERLVPLGM